MAQITCIYSQKDTYPVRRNLLIDSYKFALSLNQANDVSMLLKRKG